jgi:hypothetical protein
LARSRTSDRNQIKWFSRDSSVSFAAESEKYYKRYNFLDTTNDYTDEEYETIFDDVLKEYTVTEVGIVLVGRLSVYRMYEEN